jgi:tRNA-dihydrouridine synthase
VFRRHTALILELKAGPKVIHEIRKACAWYAKGLFGCNQLRQRIWRISDPAAAMREAEAYFAGLMARSHATSNAA